MAGPYNFVSAVLDAHIAPGTDWRRHVEESLAHRGLALVGEEIRAGGDFVGWARLYEPGEAEAAFGGAPWFSLADRGEFRGQPAGFFSWEHYGAGDGPFDRVALFDLRGTVGRLDSGASVEPIAEKDYPLDNLLGKHGFEDGDALLRLPGGAYDDAVAKRIEAALAAAGLPAAIGVGLGRESTAHNPVVLIGGRLRKGDAELPATAELLAGIRVRLPVYDLSLLSARDFWRWP